MPKIITYRNKPKDEIKMYDVRIRVTSEQKQRLRAAAAKLERDLSDWIRTTMLEKADRLAA